MKRQLKLFRAILSGALVYSSVCFTADESGQFALKGAGFLSCKNYVDERERRSSVYYMIAGWLDGFVSAHNKYVADTYDILSFESSELLLLVIDNHCQSNPDDRLYAVVNSILAKLGPDRLLLNSPAVEIAEGERRTVLRRDVIARIQRELAQRGLYLAGIDGVFTDATRSAIIAFQTDIGLETTGFPDQTTLWRLLRK